MYIPETLESNYPSTQYARLRDTPKCLHSTFQYMSDIFLLTSTLKFKANNMFALFSVETTQTCKNWEHKYKLFLIHVNANRIRRLKIFINDEQAMDGKA